MTDASVDGLGEDRVRLQRQARALGSPTRFAIFQHVARAPEPVRVAALVDRFRLNHNAVRQHLAKLCEADLLVEEFAAPNGPGRPALEYRLATEVSGTWGTASPYEGLAALLLELVAENLSLREVGARAGRRAAMTAAGDGAGPVELVVAELQRQGFAARVLPRPGGADVVIDTTPYPAAAAVHRQLLCELHRGLVEGLLQGLRAKLEVTKAEVDDDDGPACVVRLSDGSQLGVEEPSGG